MKIFIIILAFIVIFTVLHYVFPLIQVCGDSMYPTYHDKEIIIGCRLFRSSRIKKGDVIVYYSPVEEKKTVIKRVHLITKKGLYCLGDNSECSYDSRNYGEVPLKNVFCRVITRDKLVSDMDSHNLM